MHAANGCGAAGPWGRSKEVIALNEPRCCQLGAAPRGEGCPDGLGFLPACGSLATPFVAAQADGAQGYPQRKSLEEGTYYPDLNLPLHLKVNAVDLPDTPLNRLRALDFILLELGLYLDTHPFDREAAQLFQSLTEEEKTVRAQVQEDGGPLTMKNAMQKGNYCWWKGPWPWQYPEEEA